MTYPRHVTFVQEARRKPQLWRLFVGLLICVVTYLAGIALLGGVLFVLSGSSGATYWMNEVVNATGPTGMLLLLATFIGMGLGPMLAARILHKRGMGTLFGPRRQTVQDFAIAALICGLIYAGLTFLVPGPSADPGLDLRLWLTFLPMALVGLLIQTGAEEVLFRGYLQQQLAAKFSFIPAWLVLPSLVFAALHYAPDVTGANTGLVLLAVFLFGVLAADLTAHTGSIGAAWGFHFANNLIALLLVATSGPMTGLALYVLPLPASSPEMRPALFVGIATMLVTWLVLRLILGRRLG